MDAPSQHGGRRGLFITAAATAVLTVLGITLLALGSDTSDRPTSSTDIPASTTTAPDAAPPANQSPSQSPSRAAPANKPARLTNPNFGSFLPGSAPVGLDIPSIDVHTTNIVDLGLQDDGTIEVPRDASAPGWFTPGPTPGQLGPAVIAGHVDSETGPAVFYRLGQLQPGQQVDITRADGTTATFSIDRVITYDKDAFPTRAVYGPTTRAELRLITCAGDYDRDTGYDSNTVVYAHLV